MDAAVVVADAVADAVESARFSLLSQATASIATLITAIASRVEMDDRQNRRDLFDKLLSNITLVLGSRRCR